MTTESSTSRSVITHIIEMDSTLWVLLIGTLLDSSQYMYQLFRPIQRYDNLRKWYFTVNQMKTARRILYNWIIDHSNLEGSFLSP